MLLNKGVTHWSVGREVATKMSLLKSASKLILLLMGGALVAGLFTGKVSEETFKTGLLMVFTFYFANKGDPQSSQPYAGK